MRTSKIAMLESLHFSTSPDEPGAAPVLASSTARSTGATRSREIDMGNDGSDAVRSPRDNVRNGQPAAARGCQLWSLSGLACRAHGARHG
jgi:hypothetical protein